MDLKLLLLSLLMALLVFVWPIEKTVALRYILSGGLLLTLLWCTKSSGRLILQGLWSKPLLLANGLVLLLSIWLVLQALVLVSDAPWIWDELRGQWLKDVIFWALGVGLGIFASLRQVRGANNRAGMNRLTLCDSIVIGLAGIVCWNVFGCLWLWALTGEFPHMHNVTGARATDSYINNMLLAFLIGELLQKQASVKSHALPMWGYVVLVIFCIVNTAFIGARNGWIALGLLTMSGAMIHYINGGKTHVKRAVAYTCVVLGVLSIGGWISWHSDARWQSLRETLPIAWDIDTHKFWLNRNKYPLPVLTNGEAVNESNYERPAWVHAGIRLIADNPMGAGFSRHAFGHELARLYPESEPSPGLHAHSGIIDFGIGAGVPGLIVWVALMAVLISYGGVAYFVYGETAGLVLAFLTSGFLGRSVLDSSMRDHMLEQYLFVAGFLLASLWPVWVKKPPVDQVTTEV